MLPALAVTTPFASSLAEAARIADSAPRSLNEPIGWKFSSFSQMSALTLKRTQRRAHDRVGDPLLRAANLVERNQGA